MSYIYWNDYDDWEISENVIHLEQYDMYCVKFNMRDGTSRTVRVFCEKGAIPEKGSNEYELLRIVDRDFSTKVKNFLGIELIGKDGLMVKQSRDDFIYRGGSVWNNYNPISYDESGRKRLQVFEDNLFRIKLQLQAKEGEQFSGRIINRGGSCNQEQARNRSTVQIQRVNGTGKNYAISDIHGMYGSYTEVLDDYMKTFENYNFVNEKTNPEKYKAIFDSRFKNMIYYVTRDKNIDAYNSYDYKKAVKEYLKFGGLTDSEINQLESSVKDMDDM